MAAESGPSVSELQAKLSAAEEKIIQLSSKCAELMTKELRAGKILY